MTTSFKFLKAFTVILFFSLAATPIFAQVVAKIDHLGKKIIYGRVTGISYPDSNVASLSYTIVWLKDTKADTLLATTIADDDGKYQLDLTKYNSTIPNYTLGFSFIGFNPFELSFDPPQEDFNYDVQLNNKGVNACIYLDIYNTRPAKATNKKQ